MRNIVRKNAGLLVVRIEIKYVKDAEQRVSEIGQDAFVLVNALIDRQKI